MNKSQVELVQSKGFTINFPFVGSPMTARTESDEIVVLMRLTLRPGDNVMNIDFDVSACGDGATVSSPNENSSSDFSRYWRAAVHDE